MKILIADDDDTVIALLKRILEKGHHDIDIATDGAEAFQLLGQNHYDVVFSDHDMPEMTGIELIKEVKKKNPECTAVLVSGYETLTDFFVTSLGADVFIKKPFKHEVIEAIIQQHKDKKRKQ